MKKLMKAAASFALAAILGFNMAGAGITASAAKIFESSGEELKKAAEGTSGWLVQAGNPTKTFVSGKGLKISDRKNDYDSVDFSLSDCKEGVNYKLEVAFSSSGSDVFQIAEADSPWGSLKTSEKSAKATLTYEFTMTDDGLCGGQNRFRLNAKSLNDYYITSVKLQSVGAAKPAAKAASSKSQPAAETPPKKISASSTAASVAGKIKIGWNLGNTLDSSPTETSWGNPKTTKANIDGIKKAGFNAIRIPVSWSAHIDSSYKIDEAWMSRVKEVVDYAVANDMYIILNTHHDESVFKLKDKDLTESSKAIKEIWRQIAEQFKNYDEKLIFEDLNEPRTPGSANEWSGGTKEERDNLNKLHQVFVDTIRATGGNNARRVLMIPGYAASGTGLNDLIIPKDSAEGAVIVSVHAYAPYNFAYNFGSGSKKTWDKSDSSDTAEIRNVLDRAHSLFVSKGVPVIIGEFGALNKDDNNSARAELAEYYVSYAKSKGIACFIWDNGYMNATTGLGGGEGFGLYDRKSNAFKYPEIIEALMRGIK